MCYRITIIIVLINGRNFFSEKCSDINSLWIKLHNKIYRIFFSILFQMDFALEFE